MQKIYWFIFAAIAMISASLCAMEEKKLIITPEKRKKATKELHSCLDKSRHDPNFQGESLYSKCEQLLKEGADPNAEYSGGFSILAWLGLYRCEDSERNVPLSLIPLLLQYGAEIDKKWQERETALFIAAFYRRKDHYLKAYMLLQCGADVNFQNRKGETLLCMREYREDNRFLKLLLIYGADPFVQDKKGNDGFTYDVMNFSDSEYRCRELIKLHKKAQKLLQLKTQKEKEGLLPREIQKLFSAADFPYPYRGVVEHDAKIFLMRR